MNEILETKVHCPKCKSRNLRLVETGEWSTEFTVHAGKFDRKQGIHEPEQIVRLDATCSTCFHRWKVRGASQIDDAVALTSHNRSITEDQS